MNGKMHSETGAFSNDDMRAEILNPFVHKLELDNTYDKIKVGRCFEAFEDRKRKINCWNDSIGCGWGAICADSEWNVELWRCYYNFNQMFI